MSDLVERARREGSGRGELDGDGTDLLLLELADEIERLRALEADYDRLRGWLKSAITDLGEGVDPQEVRACLLDVLNHEIIKQRSP